MINKQKEFFKERLGELSEKLPQLKIRYEYRESLSTHLIEVLPFDEFETNETYILEEIEVENQFESLFGVNQEALFISSNFLTEIKNPEITFGY